MVANFLIGLREGLEGALVVSMLVAYVVRTNRRQLLPRIWGGVGLAVGISLAFGALLTFGPRELSDRGEEMIAGTLSVIAVGFVTWMVFWMAGAAKGIGAQLRSQIDEAGEARWSLALVALLAVGREGLETALFIWAATQATGGGAGGSWHPLIGAALGLGAAVLLGWMIYRGFLRINLTRFFTWTGAFLVLIAGGVLSYGIHDLQEAELLPGEHSILFDVSSTISPEGWLGSLLRGVFNFTPETTVLQGLAWLLYVVPTMVLFLRFMRRRKPAPAAPVETVDA